MYNRLDRKKNPPIIEYKMKGGFFDLIDNAVKEIFLITDKEYNLIAEELEDITLRFISRESLTYSEAKKLLLAIKSIL